MECDNCNLSSSECTCRCHGCGLLNSNCSCIENNKVGPTREEILKKKFDTEYSQYLIDTGKIHSNELYKHCAKVVCTWEGRMSTEDSIITYIQCLCKGYEKTEQLISQTI